jgi:hypothetical protein
MMLAPLYIISSCLLSPPRPSCSRARYAECARPFPRSRAVLRKRALASRPSAEPARRDIAGRHVVLTLDPLARADF